MNTSTSTFVRTEMLPQQTPPITEAGAVKWVRENLFSSVLNGILTVLGVAVVVYITLQRAPWLSRSVWVASSLS
ncbi:MAG: amino acid ABC transporter permease, partial [Pseudotabrizicola sp.]|nr:amino acid ABC transporter permease [Pseudotabrizicola sp.]